jgi:hypothetical protein
MISAALAYHKHVGAGEAKLPRMLIYHAHFDQKALRSNSGFQRRAEMSAHARVCLERLKMAVASQAESRHFWPHRSLASRDSFAKSTNQHQYQAIQWPFHLFTSRICDHFGTPRSTRPCHAFVFRPKTPRDRACRGSDRFATRTVQRLVVCQL